MSTTTSSTTPTASTSTSTTPIPTTANDQHALGLPPPPRPTYPPSAPLIWLNGWPGTGKRTIAEHLSTLLGLERTLLVPNCNYNGISPTHPETGADETTNFTRNLPLSYARGAPMAPPLTGAANRAALDARLQGLRRSGGAGVVGSGGGGSGGGGGSRGGGARSVLGHTHHHGHHPNCTGCSRRSGGRTVLKRRDSVCTLPPSAKRIPTPSSSSSFSAPSNDTQGPPLPPPRQASLETPDSPSCRPIHESPIPFFSSPSPGTMFVDPMAGDNEIGLAMTPPGAELVLTPLSLTRTDSAPVGTASGSPRRKNPKDLYLDLTLTRRGSADMIRSARRRSPAVAGIHLRDSVSSDYFPPFPSLPSSAPFSGVKGGSIGSLPPEPASAGGVMGEGPVRHRAGTLPPISLAVSEANAKMSDSVRLKRRPLSVIGQPIGGGGSWDWRRQHGAASVCEVIGGGGVRISLRKKTRQTHSWDEVPHSVPRSLRTSPTLPPSPDRALEMERHSFGSSWSAFGFGSLGGPGLGSPISDRVRTYSVAGSSFAPIGSSPPQKPVLSRIDSEPEPEVRYSIVPREGKALIKPDPKNSPPLSYGIVSLNKPKPGATAASYSASTSSSSSRARTSTTSTIPPRAGPNRRNNGVNRLSEPTPPKGVKTSRPRPKSSEFPFPGKQLRPSEIQRVIESKPSRPSIPPVRETTPIPPLKTTLPPRSKATGKAKSKPVLKLQTQTLGATKFSVGVGSATSNGRRPQSPLARTLTALEQEDMEKQELERVVNGCQFKRRRNTSIKDRFGSVDTPTLRRGGGLKRLSAGSPLRKVALDDGDTESLQTSKTTGQDFPTTPPSRDKTPRSSPLSSVIQAHHQTPQTSPPSPFLMGDKTGPTPAVPTSPSPIIPPTPIKQSLAMSTTPPRQKQQNQEYPPVPFSPTSNPPGLFSPTSLVQPFSPSAMGLFSPILSPTPSFQNPSSSTSGMSNIKSHKPTSSLSSSLASSSTSSITHQLSPPAFPPPPPPPTRTRALSDDTSARQSHRNKTFTSYILPPSLRTTTVIVTDCQTSDPPGAAAAQSFRRAALESGRPFVAITIECSGDETARRVGSMERACVNGGGMVYGGRGPRGKLRDVGVALTVRRGRGLFRFGGRAGKSRGGKGAGSLAVPGGGGLGGGGLGGGLGGVMGGALGGAQGGRRQSVSSRKQPQAVGGSCGDGEILVDEDGSVNVLLIDVTELEANEAAGKIWQFLADVDARCRVLKTGSGS